MADGYSAQDGARSNVSRRSRDQTINHDRNSPRGNSNLSRRSIADNYDDTGDNSDNHATPGRNRRAPSNASGETVKFGRRNQQSVNDAQDGNSSRNNSSASEIILMSETPDSMMKSRASSRQVTASPFPREPHHVGECGCTIHGRYSSMSTHVDDRNDDWQDGKTLAECNQNMLAYEIGCDVTFIVDTEEQVRAHSYMLMSRSAILGAKLRAIDKPQKVIPVPGITLDAMKNILTFIYTDEANLDLKMALELILPAHKFGMRNLKTKCFRHLLGEMTSDNVNLTLEKAHQFNEQEIYKRCLFFIHVNAVDVLKTANFRTLCRSCVDDIVCSDDLNADESMVFDALVMWANGDCSRRKIQATDVNRREVLGPLLFRIRFAIMDVKEFAKKLTHRDILTQEEKIELYQHFHGQTNTLPERFTKHRRKLYRINDRINMNSFAPAFDIPAIMSTPYPDSSKAVVPRDPFSNKNSFMNNLPVYRVVRFKGISGSWQMKGPDAISFRCTSAIIFRGVQIFGPAIGNDSYTVAISVFDQTDIVRSEVVSAYTKNSKTYDVLLSEPILVPTGRTFTVVTGIKGESTLRGIDGQVYASSEDVDFEFMNSSRSINGTDITMGQIPAILFSKSK